MSWLAVSVILAGLLFNQVVEHARARSAPADQASEGLSPAARYRMLFALCFLPGPFFEAATGFGVGLVVTLPLLLRLGIAPTTAAVLALYSQMLVPWGGMAVGTTVGAALAGIDLRTLGMASAALTALLLVGHLVLFWHLAAIEGLRASPRQRLDDLGWAGLLAGLLVLGNAVIAVPVAGLFAAGVLLIARHWRDHRPTAAEWRGSARAATPYLLLVMLLLFTHALPPLRRMLEHLWVWQPAAGWPAFPPFYEVPFWLCAAALAYGLTRPAGTLAWGTLLRQGARMGWPAVRTTVLFVVMAQLMSDASIPTRLAAGWQAAAGSLALYASPLLGGLAGLLTASNTASNALMMPLQAAMAGTHASLLPWLAAIQNVAGSTLTALSPIRIEMAAALAGLAGGMGRVYARAWPYGALPLALLTAALAALRLG